MNCVTQGSSNSWEPPKNIQKDAKASGSGAPRRTTAQELASRMESLRKLDIQNDNCKYAFDLLFQFSPASSPSRHSEAFQKRSTQKHRHRSRLRMKSRKSKQDIFNKASKMSKSLSVNGYGYNQTCLAMPALFNLSRIDRFIDPHSRDLQWTQLGWWDLRGKI